MPPGLQGRWLRDHTVALLDVVVEAGQHLAHLCRLDPQAEPANLDGFRVQVHAKQVALQNLLVDVREEGLIG